MKRYRIPVVGTPVAAWLVLGVGSAVFAADSYRTVMGSSIESKLSACESAKSNMRHFVRYSPYRITGDEGCQCTKEPRLSSMSS